MGKIDFFQLAYPVVQLKEIFNCILVLNFADPNIAEGNFSWKEAIGMYVAVVNRYVLASEIGFLAAG